jgi:hypothetical protein
LFLYAGTYMAGGEKSRHIDVPSFYTLWMGHLAIRCHCTSPIVMGHIPPLGVGTATNPAPARTGATARQAWPCASRFSSRIRCWTKALVIPGGPTLRRYWTRRPEGALCFVGRETP